MPTPTVPKPVMLATAQINLDDLKSTVQQTINAAWSDNEEEARNAYRRSLHKDAVFEVVMETFFGPDFFEEHYNPREEELEEG